MRTNTTSWNLTPLYKKISDPKITTDGQKLIKASTRFISKWQNRSDYLENPKVLKEALDDYEAWARNFGVSGAIGYYFSLLSALDLSDPTIKAKLTKAIDMSNTIQNAIQFFELKIAKIALPQQKKVLSYPPLSPYYHFLEKLFKSSEHLLTDPEEKILNLKSLTSHSNWVDMIAGFLAKEESQVLDENGKKTTKNFSEILGLLDNKNKKVRDSAAFAFNAILIKHGDTSEHEINSVLQNKKTNDELRGFSRPDAGRHLADDVETEVVDTLVSTITNNFSIAKRFYKLKAKLLGLSKLAYHERNVEYGNITKNYSYIDAQQLLKLVFAKLDPQFLAIFTGFVNNGQIDVYPKKGKRGGAFCTYGLPIHPTYILLNWTDKLTDVLTFAHETGHGVNDELIKLKQNALNFGTPISTAEVASTFMEDFVLREIMANTDDESKLALMMMKLNSDVSTIFRQIAFYNFEVDLHSKFRETGYLSSMEIGKLFQKHTNSYMGESVDQSPGSQNWWIYVSHFRSFFYVYSYASGLLISKSLQAMVKANPQDIEKVKLFLSTGLSDSPKNIFAKLGIDITDKKFWSYGLAEIGKLLSETENLAKKLKKI